MAKVIRMKNTEGLSITELYKAGRKLNGIQLKVGLLGSDKYTNVKPAVSVASIAMTNEFGNITYNQIIPPRPFMRHTVEREEDNWRKLINQESSKIFEGKQTPKGLFELLGSNVSADIVRSIEELFEPKLHPLTIAIRKRKVAREGLVLASSLHKPLIETGLMKSLITHEIEDSL